MVNVKDTKVEENMHERSLKYNFFLFSCARASKTHRFT